MITRHINGLLGLVNKRIVTAPDPQLPCIHTIRLDDLTFPFWIGNQHAKRWWMRDRLEMRGEYSFLKASLAAFRTAHPGPFHVFDIGAHHGIQTIPMALWGGKDCTVHAVEANADNALVVSANVALNRLPNVDVIHAAAGGGDSELTFAGESVGRGRGGRKLKAISLDSLCAKSRIDPAAVAYLKIDVEGFETDVLSGAQALLKARPFINLEVHGPDLGRYGSSVERVMRLLPLEHYDARVLRREIDWNQTKPIASVSELPTAEVCNLLMSPRKD